MLSSMFLASLHSRFWLHRAPPPSSSPLSPPSLLSSLLSFLSLSGHHNQLIAVLEGAGEVSAMVMASLRHRHHSPTSPIH